MSCDLLCIGELLWDELPDGRRPGGAPMNVCLHLAQTGMAVRMASAVGADDDGAALRAQAGERGLNLELISEDPEHPTGRVAVSLDAGGVPKYTIFTDVAWDFIPLSEQLLQTARSARAICFGSLAQRSERSRRTIQSVLTAAPDSTWKVFDLNLRPPFVDANVLRRGMQLANVVKISDEELPQTARLLGLPEMDIETIVEQLLECFELQVLALTLGKDGSLLCRPGQPPEHAGIIPTTVADTVGAGDSFTSILIYGLLNDWSDERIGSIANQVTSFVVSQHGATPIWPEQLRATVVG